MPKITAEDVRKHFDYCPETGLLTWKLPTNARFRIGQVAGAVKTHNGKILMVVGILGQRYMIGRVIWLYVTGAWPQYEVDHKDGDATNQRWDNLRDVPQAVNAENKVRACRGRRSGSLLGAYWNRRLRKWAAQITVRRKALHLGLYDSEAAAHQAYLEAKRQLHVGCTI